MMINERVTPEQKTEIIETLLANWGAHIQTGMSSEDESIYLSIRQSPDSVVKFYYFYPDGQVELRYV